VIAADELPLPADSLPYKRGLAHRHINRRLADRCRWHRARACLAGVVPWPPDLSCVWLEQYFGPRADCVGNTTIYGLGPGGKLRVCLLRFGRRRVATREAPARDATRSCRGQRLAVGVGNTIDDRLSRSRAYPFQGCGRYFKYHFHQSGQCWCSQTSTGPTMPASWTPWRSSGLCAALPCCLSRYRRWNAMRCA
jgi:hypothetical protein